MLIIVIVVVAGEFLLALLVGRILRSSSELDFAAESKVIPFPQREPKGLPASMPLGAADVGYPDGDAA